MTSLTGATLEGPVRQAVRVAPTRREPFRVLEVGTTDLGAVDVLRSRTRSEDW